MREIIFPACQNVHKLSTDHPHVFHRAVSPRHLRSAFCCLCAARATAQPAPAEASLYRVFLRDGSTLLSYGEFARVSDRIVMSVPLGDTVAGPDLHLVSIPSGLGRLGEDRRLRRLRPRVALRGHARSRRLRAVEQRGLDRPHRHRADDGSRAQDRHGGEARQNVTRWIAEHYGYRAEDVARMAALFDDVVAETRAAAGEKNFDLSLIANLAVPPSVPLLPSPTLRESVEQALRAAALAPDATERTSLLRADRPHAHGSTATAASRSGCAPLRARV